MTFKILKEFKLNPEISFNHKNEIVDFKGKINENYVDNKIPQWDKLLKQYGDLVKLKDWHEKTVSLTNLEKFLSSLNNDKVTIETGEIDTYSIDAFRNGYWGKDIPLNEFPFYNLVTVGCLITKDNKLMIGRKNKKGSPGNFSFAPGGHVTSKENYIKNPLDDAILMEANEEVGDFDYHKPEFLGAFAIEEGGRKGIKFAIKLHTDAKSNHIIDAHNFAYGIYSSAKLKGASELDARAEIAKHGNLPQDAWEFYDVTGLDHSYQTLNDFYNQNKETNLSDVGRGTFQILLNTLSK